LGITQGLFRELDRMVEYYLELFSSDIIWKRPTTSASNDDFTWIAIGYGQWIGQNSLVSCGLCEIRHRIFVQIIIGEL